MLVRSLLAVVAATITLGMTLEACTAEPGTTRSNSARAAAVDAENVEPHELRVLHAWDARRAATYAGGDVPALRRLYVDGSRAGTRDVTTLRSYVDRGLHVEDLRMQVLGAEVLRDDRAVVRVHVRERVASGLVSGAGGDVPLPRDRVDAHVITFVRPGGAWVVRSVTDPGD